MEPVINKQVTQADVDGDSNTLSILKPDVKTEPVNSGMKAIIRAERTFFDRVKICAAAYIGALALIGVMVPFAASVMMVAIYIVHPNFLFWLNRTSRVLPLLGSTIITVLIWAIAGFFFSFFTTAKAANPRSYGLLRSRLCQLKADLAIEDADSECEGLQKFGDIKAAVEKVNALASINAKNMCKGCNQKTLSDAYTCYIDISRMLHQSPAGLLWLSGMGYINAWRLLHHAEEALIESQPTEEVIRGAIHDKLAIQGSTISRKDELLDKLLQAVSVIQPAADVYFKEHQPDKGDTAFNQLTEAFKQKALNQLIHENQLSDSESKVDRHEAEKLARVALREVRRTLNDFRDKSWEGIVRARNRLLGSIVITGIVTHILLGLTILIANTPGINNPSAIDNPSAGIIAATAFYLVGAVTGLFGRFYRESVAGSAVDDFGFATARLIATPVLSGLAGIGGVMLTVMLANTIGDATAQQMSLDKIFHMDAFLFFAAAIFGLAPNLLIKGLQDKASKFETDIQSSKAAETDAGSAGN